MIGYLNKRDEAESMLDDFGIDEAAFMCKEQGGRFERPSTFLGDTGASTHMVGDDDGMFDCKDINEPVTVGDGKKLIATKIGRLRRTVYQVDGRTQDIVLEDVKLVPGLDTPLFAILKALDQGWRIKNRGVLLTLIRKGVQVTFDRILTTRNGKLVGVALLPCTGQGSKEEVAMPMTEEHRPVKCKCNSWITELLR